MQGTKPRDHIHIINRVNGISLNLHLHRVNTAMLDSRLMEHPSRGHNRGQGTMPLRSSALGVVMRSGSYTRFICCIAPSLARSLLLRPSSLGEEMGLLSKSLVSRTSLHSPSLSLASPAHCPSQ
jgi:hypothetical protein